jgi:hypothetical protein
MAIPNLMHEVDAARRKYPQAWANAHTGGPGTEDFIRLLARDLRLAHGPRWGLNGKRGNPNDISDDVIAYQGEGTAVDVTNGNTAMEIIDVIGKAGNPVNHPDPNERPFPVWNVGPGGIGDRGAFVGTFSVPDSPGTPGVPGTPATPSCPDPSAHQPKPKPSYPGDRPFDAVGQQLEADYREAGQTLNAQSATWFSRTIWDHVVEGLSLDASIAKHRTEWRQALGLR